jgi:hypothetical protein
MQRSGRTGHCRDLTGRSGARDASNLDGDVHPLPWRNSAASSGRHRHTAGPTTRLRAQGTQGQKPTPPQNSPGLADKLKKPQKDTSKRTTPPQIDPCSQVTDRILSAPREALDLALVARKQYEKLTQGSLRKLEDEIDLHKKLRKHFDVARAAERTEVAKEIRAAEKAIRDGRSSANAEISSIQSKIRAIRRLGGFGNTSALERELSRLRSLLNRGEWNASSAILKKTQSLKAWQQYVAARRRWDQERERLYRSGRMVVLLDELGVKDDWNGVQKRIRDAQARVRDIQHLTSRQYLAPLGREVTGKELNDLIAKRRKFVLKLEEEIARGEHKLHIPELRGAFTRNQVLRKIEEKRRKLNELDRAWKNGRYRVHNGVTGRVVSLTELRKRHDSLRKSIADLEARGAAMDEPRKQLRKVEAEIAAHEQLWRNERDKCLTDIETRLRGALAKTPCLERAQPKRSRR